MMLEGLQRRNYSAETIRAYLVRSSILAAKGHFDVMPVLPAMRTFANASPDLVQYAV
jgi:hypothetical protein